VENGIAIKVSFQQMSSKKLLDALTQILNDPSYRERMAIVSQRLRDQPEKPIDRAVWWVEWVLRNPKPEHLASPTMQLGSFRSNLFDVYLGIVGLLALLVRGGIAVVGYIKRADKSKRE
jgi:glucuronosyltransferase